MNEIKPKTHEGSNNNNDNEGSLIGSNEKKVFLSPLFLTNS